MVRISFKARRNRKGASKATSAVLHARKQRRGVWWLYLFFGFFAVFGSIFLIVFFIVPVLNVIAARNWTPTPCTIISSEVSVHDGDDNDTYSVAITFRYEVSGRSFTSDRYSFVTGSSSGRSGKQRIVDAHRPGSTKTCYVNPADPQDAMLNPGMTAGIWVGLMAGVFPAIGIGGIVGVAISRRKRKRRDAGDDHAAQFGDEGDELAAFLPKFDPHRDLEPVTLSPAGNRIAGVIGIIFFAAFWNGIISIFLYQAFQSHRSGRPDWFLTIFMIPFVLVGIASIVFVLYFLLGLLNPRPILTLSSRAVELGQMFDVQWQVRGNAHRMRNMSIELRGREEATYRRGTDSVTDKHTFAVIPLLDTDDAITMTDGSASAPIPPTTMHSMQLPNNKIVWAIHVEGKIPRFPDVKDEYVITVLPCDANVGGTRRW